MRLEWQQSCSEWANRQRHIAGTASDIEHLHAPPKARAPQYVLGEFLELCTLVREALGFLSGIAKGIVLPLAHGRSTH